MIKKFQPTFEIAVSELRRPHPHRKSLHQRVDRHLRQAVRRNWRRSLVDSPPYPSHSLRHIKTRDLQS